MSESIKTTLNKKPIGSYRTKNINPIGKPIGQSSKTYKDDIVDALLEDCSDLIDKKYLGWFAKRFYKMNPDHIKRFASEARQEGRNPQSLFTYKIRKAAE